jgi:hypothetical protein
MAFKLGHSLDSSKSPCSEGTTSLAGHLAPLPLLLCQVKTGKKIMAIRIAFKQMDRNLDEYSQFTFLIHFEH